MPNHISNSVAPILFTTACLLGAHLEAQGKRYVQLSNLGDVDVVNIRRGCNGIRNLGRGRACYSLGASKNTTCQSPSFTPIFTPIYELTSIRSDILDDLPDQFPLAPTALFLGTLLGVFAWMASILASLPFHIKSLTRLEKRRQYFTKATLYCGGVSVLFGLIASIALRLQLGNVVDAVSSRARQDTAASSITLGSGFSRE
ncbi:hypothetical protein RQP46_004785 [Phenoliferia psychrophenolica]